MLWQKLRDSIPLQIGSLTSRDGVHRPREGGHHASTIRGESDRLAPGRSDDRLCFPANRY